MNEQEFTARVLAAEPPTPSRDNRHTRRVLRPGRRLAECAAARLAQTAEAAGEDKFESWLTRILVNECRDALRRRRRAPLPVRDVPDAPVPAKNEALRAALFSLNPELP